MEGEKEVSKEPLDLNWLFNNGLIMPYITSANVKTHLLTTDTGHSVIKTLLQNTDSN